MRETTTTRSTAQPPPPFPANHSLDYFLRSMAAGGVAGCVAKTLTAPLDRVKILFQGYSPPYKRYIGKKLGVFRAVRDIYTTNGVRGMFQGHSVMLLRIFPSAAIRFMTYEQLKMLLIPTQDLNTPFRHFLAGSLAGNAAVLVTYPLEVVRSRLAFQIRQSADPRLLYREPQSHFGIIPTCRLIYADAGGSLRGFYKGFGPTMLGIVPYAGVAFTTYQSLKEQCLHEWRNWATTSSKQRSNSGGKNSSSNNDNPQLTVWAHLAVGGVAGLAGQTVAYPLDTIRHRMQLAGVTRSIPVYQHTWDAVKTIMRTEGPRGFFLGLSINYWKTIPANAVAFVVYDRMKHWLDL